MRKCVFIALFLCTFAPLAVSAHPGNTASDGCHYCRTNCDKWGVAWNERHCHASKGVPQPTEPIRSIRGEPQGTSVPAPEYKTYTPKPAEKVNVSVPVGTTNTSPKTEAYVPVPQTTYQEPAPARTPNVEVSQPKQEKRNFIWRFFSWLF